MNVSVISSVIFWLIVLLTAGSSIFVVTSRNILHAAFSLCLAFLGVGAIYIFLHADFVAAVQLIVYVGGILVLIMFAVMFSSNVVEDTAEHGRSHLAMIAGGTAAVALFAAIVLLTQRLQGPLASANKFGSATYAHTVSVMAVEAPRAPAEWKELNLAKLKDNTEVPAALSNLPSAAVPAVTEVRESWMRDFPRSDFPTLHIAAAVFRFSDSNAALQYATGLQKIAWVGASGFSVAQNNDHIVAVFFSVDDEKRTPPQVQRYVADLADNLLPELSRFGEADLSAAGAGESGLGHYLMGQYMLPFEVVSILLLAALIGAVVIVRKELS